MVEPFCSAVFINVIILAQILSCIPVTRQFPARQVVAQSFWIYLIIFFDDETIFSPPFTYFYTL